MQRLREEVARAQEARDELREQNGRLAREREIVEGRAADA